MHRTARTHRSRALARTVVTVAVVAAALAVGTTAPAGGEPDAGPADGPIVIEDSDLGHAVEERAKEAAADYTPPTAPHMCIGDGVSGNRVQLWYVRRADQPSRFAEITPQMQEWATQIDRITLEAASTTGGFRRIRWVTGTDCVPTVREHVMPADSDGDFGRMLVSLSDAGHRPPNRKLLIAHDTPGYCGFGEVWPDDTKGAGNKNDTQDYGLGGAVAEFCWGFEAAAHELYHVLGSVQPTAPNGTPGSHCTDEYDLMCYADGTGGPLTFPCERANFSLLDCNHDDYFNVNPPAGSWLAEHWNVADSSFLDRAPWYMVPERPENPKLTVGTASATVTWDPPVFDGASPITSYLLTAHPSGKVTTVPGTARSATIGGLADGETVWFTINARTAKGTGPESIETQHLTPTPTIYTRPFFTGEDPTAVAASPAGITYVGTKGGLVKVDVAGKRTKIASSAGTVRNPPVEGVAVAKTPMRPVGIAVHPKTGDVYVADRLTNRVRRITAGRVYTVAGGATKFVPEQLAFDPKGNLYITEPSRNRVWKKSTSGTQTVFAGSPTGAAGYSGDDGSATAALLRAPSGVAVDPSGNVYVADRGNHRIRKVTPGGTITHFAGNGADIVVPDMAFDGTEGLFLLLPRPRGIAWGNGRLYFQSGGRVIAMTPDTLHVTYVGRPGVLGDTGDKGPARRALIGDDVQLATWGGRLVVLDMDADRLRQVAPPAPAKP